MTAINVPEFMRQVGLEELAKIEREELATNFIPAAVTGLADGDIAAMHEEYTGKKAELYGQSLFSDGRVARVVLNAALDNGMKPGEIYDFQSFAAEYFTDPNSTFGAMQDDSAVHIFPEAITIDNNPIALPRTPELVIDYAACLTSRSYLGDQMDFLRTGNRPFLYSPLTRLHFTNQSILNTYDQRFGMGVTNLVIDRKIYLGREDGITSATNEMIRAQQAHGAPVDVADIILCTGSQHTTGEELHQGIANAHTLLREGVNLP